MSLQRCQGPVSSHICTSPIGVRAGHKRPNLAQPLVDRLASHAHSGPSERSVSAFRTSCSRLQVYTTPFAGRQGKDQKGPSFYSRIFRNASLQLLFRQEVIFKSIFVSRPLFRWCPLSRACLGSYRWQRSSCVHQCLTLGSYLPPSCRDPLSQDPSRQPHDVTHSLTMT